MNTQIKKNWVSTYKNQIIVGVIVVFAVWLISQAYENQKREVSNSKVDEIVNSLLSDSRYSNFKLALLNELKKDDHFKGIKGIKGDLGPIGPAGPQGPTGRNAAPQPYSIFLKSGNNGTASCSQFCRGYRTNPGDSAWPQPNGACIGGWSTAGNEGAGTTIVGMNHNIMFHCDAKRKLGNAMICACVLKILNDITMR